MALSGAGLLSIEATAVEPEGRITAGDLGLWNDVTEAALRPVLAAIRQYSSISVTMQLAHAGRKASSAGSLEGRAAGFGVCRRMVPAAPSALPHKERRAGARRARRRWDPACPRRVRGAARRAHALGT